MEKWNKKIKFTPNTPENESGLTQMIMEGEFNRQIWVNHQDIIIMSMKVYPTGVYIVKLRCSKIYLFSLFFIQNI